MNVDIDLAKDAAGRSFLTWSPVKASARLRPGSAQVAAAVTLRNAGPAAGGRVVFDSQRSDSGKAQLVLQLPSDGTPVDFWVAGEFQNPSTDYGDAVIEAVDATQTQVGSCDLMVRIRKDATTLTGAERDRFLVALGRLNDAGRGPFQSYRDTHVANAQDEAHGYAAFPPWHRAYLLDLERELQALDSSVTLPYWRFDQPAPSLFADDFMGATPPNVAQGDLVRFVPGHGLEFWKTDTSDPIERRPHFNIAQAPRVLSQTQTMVLGNTYAAFRSYEGAPHGTAHVSFNGPINSVPTAAKDPLFFLLHANVDRLWAYWQWINQRTDVASALTYSTAGPQRPPNNIGHRLNDTMWPWNGSNAAPRPRSPAPRTSFPSSSIVNRPGPTPMVQDMIDYQGVHSHESLGFDYDDVPFEL